MERLLLRPEVMQAYEDGGKQDKKGERWEKHFKDMTENKMICQQSWGLQPKASFPAPLTVPWPSFCYVFFFPGGQRVAVVWEYQGKNRKDYGSPAISKSLYLETYFYLIL